MNERNIPDVWKVFGGEHERQIRPRRNSWQKMVVSEEEKTITDLFSDIHIHAGYQNNQSANDIYDDDDVTTNRKNSSAGLKSCVPAANNHQISKEFKNMEKHLSMKKTIRKKMMRDLKQAILDSEAGDSNIHVAPRTKDTQEPNLLELLKNSEIVENKPEMIKKPGFWAKLTKRAKSKR